LPVWWKEKDSVVLLFFSLSHGNIPSSRDTVPRRGDSVGAGYRLCRGEQPELDEIEDNSGSGGEDA